MRQRYNIPVLPLALDLETKKVLIQLNAANRQLAELKGVSLTIPNEKILINTLTLQEAKDSSAVENIVTTHDDLYRAGADITMSAATKEVLNYSNALKYGFELVCKNKLLSNSNIKEIQQELEQNDAGFRSAPGTALKNQQGEIVYTPPQNKQKIEDYMSNLELFINNDEISDIDPLIKMAIIHHQFESIHPFYDGNGRTGRIINILYLVNKGLLDIPILYLSRYITRNKAEYYRLLQTVRDSNGSAELWQEWICFILKGIEQTAQQTTILVKEISRLMAEYKQKMRPEFGKSYKHELLNNLFNHPYTKIEFVMQDIGVGRVTATKYLDKLVDMNLLEKSKVGRTNYYLNMALIKLFVNSTTTNAIEKFESVESVNN
ncbi:hypothetical protein AwDysgo_05790 [Bacteroidales bacterium]|nr:hypothetical protein AwDysgo_05790 [Bacteroidales bacterium]